MIQPDPRASVRPRPAAGSFAFVVDDDTRVRDSLAALLRSVDLQVRLFDTAAELESLTFPEDPGCIVLDIRPPASAGLDYRDQVARLETELPVVLMTEHGDIPMAVQAMKAGAVDFLPKPFREQDMLDAVSVAIARDAKRRDEQAAQDGLRALHATLTSREQEVFEQVTRGLLNKQIAGNLGLSEITIKIHRCNVMRR